MAHAHFREPFTFTPDEDRRVSVRYPAGWRGVVRRQCLKKAAAAGKAEEAPPPRRQDR